MATSDNDDGGADNSNDQHKSPDPADPAPKNESESDLDSEEYDSDEDTPLVVMYPRAGQAANDCPSAEQWDGPGSHPLPIPSGWTTQLGLSHGPHTLSRIRAVLMTNDWKDTVAEVQEPSRRSRAGGNAAKAPKIQQFKEATLTRLDREQFHLVPGGVLAYVLYEITGLELIYVDSIFRERNCKDLKVSYTRVLSTIQARDQCRGNDDLVEQMACQDGRSVTTTRLGNRSLSEVHKKSAKNSRLTFHRGDYPYVACASCIVGFIGLREVARQGGKVTDTEDKRHARELLPAVKKVQPHVKAIEDFDWVYWGADFSDQDPNEEPDVEEEPSAPAGRSARRKRQ